METMPQKPGGNVPDNAQTYRSNHLVIDNDRK